MHNSIEFMKLREITAALEDYAPLALQDGFDNAGLQIGLTEDVDATGALLCLDVTEDVIDEAIGNGCNVIISHHPLLFHPVKQIDNSDYVRRCIMKAIKGNIAIYSAHTNLDNAEAGVNFKIAEKIGLNNLKFLKIADNGQGGSGVVGTLDSPIDKDEFVDEIKRIFKVGAVRYNQWTGTSISKVALCGGAGAFLISDAIREKADVFITGEIGYHRFFGHENDIMLMEIGHYESEQYTIELLQEIMQQKCPNLRKVIMTSINTNPISYR